ncbi:hypothetical protein [Streptomyces sp. NPDC021212]|uniref:hypothetical protein n=1 Tax=Streptomyces sp. NPDC021212 TaxID=3365118 RepID=UPI0037A0FD88
MDETQMWTLIQDEGECEPLFTRGEEHVVLRLPQHLAEQRGDLADVADELVTRLVRRLPAGQCDHDHDTCNIDFIDPATGAFVYYSNGRWGRTATEEHHQRIADLNATALA